MDISKGGHLFGLSQHIASFLDKTFEDLKQERHLNGADRQRFANRAAYYLGEINAVHPFREGNGRTQREFIRQLALKNAYAIDWSSVSAEQMIDASRQSFKSDNSGLEKLLQNALRN